MGVTIKASGMIEIEGSNSCITIELQCFNAHGNNYLFNHNFSDFFKIQETTGHVTIRQGLTALPRHLAEQKLVIFATDGGGLHTNITIILDIVDVNDHVPLFREKDNQEISVLEVNFFSEF